ncbi:MAG: hypothetical protein MJH10_20115 [Epibacterium sp.]|nr:hypothetical protein [Epibacterium sp.]NQX75782.1 hypothetical protein [Epibacterium sp.]
METELDSYVYPGKRLTKNGHCSGHGQGMTLRDWFAGQVMASLVASQAFGSPDSYAKEAYQQADAMLNARDRSDEPGE